MLIVNLSVPYMHLGQFTILLMQCVATEMVNQLGKLPTSKSTKLRSTTSVDTLYNLYKLESLSQQTQNSLSLVVSLEHMYATPMWAA